MQKTKNERTSCYRDNTKHHTHFSQIMKTVIPSARNACFHVAPTHGNVALKKSANSRMDTTHILHFEIVHSAAEGHRFSDLGDRITAPALRKSLGRCTVDLWGTIFESLDLLKVDLLGNDLERC